MIHNLKEVVQKNEEEKDLKLHNEKYENKYPEKIKGLIKKYRENKKA